MSADNRSVHTDALATLGTIIDDTQRRDAIHLAVIPMQSRAYMVPGQHVNVNGNPVEFGEGVGIVDPFLGRKVEPGERFWCVIYPRVISSLRHVWAHPAFEDEAAGSSAPSADKAAAEAWLREFCEGYDRPNYDLLIEALMSDDGEATRDDDGDYYGVSIEDGYILTRGHDSHGDIPREFWDHAETLTGKKFASRPGHFSCSC